MKINPEAYFKTFKDHADSIFICLSTRKCYVECLLKHRISAYQSENLLEATLRRIIMSFTSVLWEFNFYTVKCQILSGQFRNFFHVYTSTESAPI